MSPAGHWPQLRAAIEAGADAVYFGLKHFTARAKVGFSLEELPDAMRTLHKRGVRGYVTFNTLIFEHELREAAKTAAAIVEAGADALIIQDPGIMKLVREIAPGVELHASTQMSITDAEGVRFAQKLGANRVTLARELSIAEVKCIHDQTGFELEMFVHGALCVAYSGQCFSSEAWGGRSANRGQCAQACRLPYDLMVDGHEEPLGDARYLLSPGDLYTLKQVPEIVASGVGALKIEGRYKDADYVALTTAAYRKAVDEAWAGRKAEVTAAEELQLEQVYSRGLGPYFVNGTDHQAVVRGRAPRHRGVLMGKVEQVTGESVVMVVTSKAGLREGDGVVFDAADWRSPEEPEEGGRVYEVLRGRGGRLELKFGNRAVRFERIRPGDLVWRSSSPEVEQAARVYTEAQAPVHRRKVDIRVTAHEGEKLRAEWTVEGKRPARVVVESVAALGKAEKRGITVESLREQFGRLGGTAYELGSVALDVQGTPFAPVSLLNQMRREAVEKLERHSAEASTPDVRPVPARAFCTDEANPAAECELHLLVRTPEQLEAALEARPASITLDYLDLYGLRPSVERVRAAGVAVRVASPRVLKPGEAKIVDFLVSLECPILVRATGILNALQVNTGEANRTRVLIGDFSLNAANSLSAAEYFALGLERLTPTHDLNAEQVAALARDSGASKIEAILYQHLPVFHTEHCVFCRFLSTGTSYKDCGRPCEKHRVELRDSAGRLHPVMADVGCRNTVFGAEAQEASAHFEAWRAAGIRHYRLEFAHETAAEVREVAGLFARALAGRMTGAELGRRLKATAPGGTTQGSLFVAPKYQLLPVLQ